MRNSTRYDLGTTSAQHSLCFAASLTKSNVYGYDLGTTLVRPRYDLSKAWVQVCEVPTGHPRECSAFSFFRADRSRGSRHKAIRYAWGGASPQQCQCRGE